MKNTLAHIGSQFRLQNAHAYYVAVEVMHDKAVAITWAIRSPR
jgi:hypothetical protein